MICGLLFFAATVNYMDRQVIALLKPTLQVQFGWTEIGYSNIVLAFQFAYAIGLLFVGKLIDKLGTRKGFSIAVFLWSLAAMAHAAAGSVFQFAVARFSLGLGESGSFPASIKAVAEWFPKRRARARHRHLQFRHKHRRDGDARGRALADLSFRMADGLHRHGRGGIRLDRVLARALSPPGRRPLGSRRRNWPTSRAIRPIQNARKRRFPGELCSRCRQAWAIALGKFFTDPIWWVYLFWMPDFLSRNLGLNLTGHAVAAVRHLQRSQRRKHRRRMAFVLPAEKRVVGERQPQDRACWFARWR